jgi:hypothetical protein
MSEESSAASGGTSDVFLWIKQPLHPAQPHTFHRTLAQNCTYDRDKLVNFGHLSGKILRTLGFRASREFNETCGESCHQNSSKKVSLR